MAMRAQGRGLEELPYRARFFPAGAVVALVACAAIIVGQAYEPATSGEPLGDILMSYAGVPVFFALWWGHKLVTRAPKVDPAAAELGRK